MGTFVLVHGFSTVAEQRHERIAHLVYLAAFMLPRGVIPSQFVQTSREFHDASRLSRYRVIEPDAGIHWIVPDGVRDFFLNDADDVDVAWVTKRLQHDYLAPLSTPMQVSGERWGSIPRTYIETLHDRAIPIAAQRKMQRLSPGATGAQPRDGSLAAHNQARRDGRPPAATRSLAKKRSTNQTRG